MSLMAFEEVPEIVYRLHARFGRPLAEDIATILYRVATLRPGHALRMHVAPGTGARYRQRLHTVRRRWPGTRIVVDRDVIDIIPPQTEGDT
jgi:hypothetical protein